MYKVSILVPVHNVEKFIEKCARSLFEQTYENLEYVFVDDCSPDKSIGLLSGIAEEYTDRKQQIKLVRNEFNKGASESKNIAVANATGEFVSFVDSDDWLELDAIESLMREQICTNADVVWGKAMMHTKNEIIELQEPNYGSKHEWLLCYSRFTTGLVMTNSKRIIRRELFVNHGIRSAEGLNYSEDKLLMSQVAYYAQSFSTIDKVVYHYNRMNPHQATAKQTGHIFNVDVFRQEYGSLNLIEMFFSDKEQVYYEEAARAKMRYLRDKQQEALQCSSREGFNAIVANIKGSNPKFWGEIGWGGWKRILYGSYDFMKYFLKVKRRIKRLNRHV